MMGEAAHAAEGGRCPRDEDHRIMGEAAHAAEGGLSPRRP